MEFNFGFWVDAARVTLLVAAFAAFAWALLRMRRESADQAQRLEASWRQLSAEHQVLADKLTALATLVAALPVRGERAAEAPPPPPRQAPRRDGVRSYETAKRLARSGASVEEIVATCGVAGTEARLLLRLHGADAHHDSAA